jgi:hypothetical protein
MTINIPTPPTAPDLNSPSTYNARVLAGFNWAFNTMPNYLEGLSAEDFFSVQTSTTDPTAGRLQIVGAFGPGGSAGIVIADLDNQNLKSGLYNCVNGTTANNTVDGTSFNGSVLVTNRANGARVTQLLMTEGTNGAIYQRSYNGGWGAFIQILTNDSIQSDDNASGEFVKFPDGTAICTRTIAAADRTTSSTSGGLNRSAAEFYNFPISLSSVEYVDASMGAGNGWWSACANNSTQWSLTLLRVDAATSVATNDTKLYAVGRWF